MIFRKILWWIFAILCIGVGLYPVSYLFLDQDTGFLSSKSTELLSNAFWKIGFYSHIGLGGIALLTGWSQFSTKLRSRRLTLHRQLGKAYVVAVLVSGTAGVSIGFFATGGPVAAAGFISLGVIWLFTTWRAYQYVRQGDLQRHQVMMYYSYAACFAAVTLRLWLPILIPSFGGRFIPAYRLVAWLCWVPNLAIAHYLVTTLRATAEKSAQYQPSGQ